jgi:hypothetical protein
MPQYSDEARDGAAADAEYDARKEAIANCKEADPEFVWKWRIVENSKLPYKRIKHLSKWCEEQISEELDAMAEHSAEQKDPYGYRGLSRSMFI